MDILKAEILRKKRQIEDSKVLVPEKKFFKRSDLAAKQEEAYWKRQRETKDEEARQEKVIDSSATETGSTSGKQNIKEKHVLPRKEVLKRLRERQEPIRLFGESDEEAFERLRRLEMLTPEMNKGFKNDMKAAMDKVDEAYLNEILRSGGETDDSKSNDVKVRDDGTTMDDILILAKDFGTGDEALDCDVILKFFKLLLKCWGDELNSRPLEEKRSFKGKLTSATHTQTVSYIKTLFRKLKQRKVTSDILGCLVDITKHMLDRDYIKANDAYLEMAIGNAPWPIGVTMVGIHARTGREKIFARNVAHVLNDETQRKYIQALKRLMTCCQRFFVTDPSRSVNFEGPIH